MATRAVVETLPDKLILDSDWVLNTWSGLLNGDDGSPVRCVSFSDRSVQVDGTAGEGGTLVIEGSNDGVTYYTLDDPQGNALSFTAPKIESVLELVQFIRPRVTAGDETTEFKVTLLGRR